MTTQHTGRGYNKGRAREGERQDEATIKAGQGKEKGRQMAMRKNLTMIPDAKGSRGGRGRGLLAMLRGV